MPECFVFLHRTTLSDHYSRVTGWRVWEIMRSCKDDCMVSLFLRWGRWRQNINSAHFLTEPECILSSVTADVDCKTFIRKWKKKITAETCKTGMTFPGPSFLFDIELYTELQMCLDYTEITVKNKGQMRHCGISCGSSDLSGCSWFPGNLRPEITCKFCPYE